MNIGVIGGGAVGLLVSGYLSTEHAITIYVRRNEQKEKINKYGLFISGQSTPCYVKALLTKELKKEDCLIICVKQMHLPEIISVIQDSIHTPVIFLQNGMGHIDYLEGFCQPVFVGVVEHGALRIDDNVVDHTGQGTIKLALFQGEPKDLEVFVSQLSVMDFPFYSAESWKQLLSKKLVINAVINPLTALFDVKNGDVIHNPFIVRLAKELCKEASDTLDLDFVYEWSRVEIVATNTQENISSMLKDNSENRKTEIEAISGYLLKKSNHHLPYTSFVYNSIRALEIKKGITK